jgi:hypothetical protein
VKPWHWWAASVALELAAGASVLAGYRCKAIARTSETWDAVSDKREGVKEDGVSGDDS